MSIDWLKIRPWNGSQNSGFEELCCQLAEHAAVPTGSRFVRKGAPDAGVECFWTLPDKQEWGWQAKFFLAALTEGQWAQINGSVRTALTKHPRLTKYTICLPMNFSDARVGSQKSGLDRWDDHVKEWVSWASDRGMQTEFVLWDESRIVSMLAGDEHRGRRLFWFDQEVFSSEWFATRLKEALANAGPRYTPELNVGLPIAGVFEGLGRTRAFYDRFRVLYGKLRKQSAYRYPRDLPDSLAQPFQRLQSALDEVLSTLAEVKESIGSGQIPFETLAKRIATCDERVRDCRAALDEYAKFESKEGVAAQASGGETQYRRSSRDFRYDLYKLSEIMRDIEVECFSDAARVSNLGTLLVVGDAGIGKTHLLMDVAEKRAVGNQPTIVLLGEQFINGEPWAQLLHLLGLRCNRDEFLGALDAAGSAGGGRALLEIDALNEGEGTAFWSKHLAGMISTLSRYKHVGLAVTVRSSYESVVIPDGLVPDKLFRVVHEGFSENEYQATRTFFDYFGIQHPSVPLLAPEFQNPLFLKTFCKALQNSGLTRVPHGFTGITQLLTFFLDSVNTKLSAREHLDFDSRTRAVNNAVEKLARAMAEGGKTHLGRDEARTLVDAVLPRPGYAQSLFLALISEGILSEERIWNGSTVQYQDVVRFAYERFTDHLIAKYLLDTNLKSGDPADDFAPGSTIGVLFKDVYACGAKRGLLDALCIQVPERLRKELPDLMLHCAEYGPMRRAFVDSLIWRDPKAINDATLKYVNAEVLRHWDARSQFLDALLTVAVYPSHPYNAAFLHRHLMKFRLAERDAWWSIFLQGHYGEGGAVDRLIDWALSPEPKVQVEDDSVVLAGIALAWFLTSSNRYLRDRATKALVALLTARIEILRRLLSAFREVNDPYVSERVYAVAYGCALRTTEAGALAKLAQNVYDFVFSTGNPVPHVLLRDYARGVIERALWAGAKLKVRASFIRPPYRSAWPAHIPSKKKLEEQYGRLRGGASDNDRGTWTIYDSVMGFGDFARYIIGTNSGRNEYSSQRLGAPRRPTYKEQYREFVKSLTKKQKAAFRSYEVGLRDWHARSFLERMNELVKKVAPAGTSPDRVAPPKRGLLRPILGRKKYKVFTSVVCRYLDNSSVDVHQDAFDLEVAQRWILQKVFDLGWTPEKFGRFDDNLASRGREEHKSERIGKKYQWIAYHEFLARLTDNFAFRGDPWSGAPEGYHGPWQLYDRDIDPSIVISRTPDRHRDAWWAPHTYDDWAQNPDDGSWIADSTDLPDAKSLLLVVNPEDGSRWLNLEGWYHWNEPAPPEEERYEKERREIWYQTRSYLVRRGDAVAVFNWAKEQHFMGRWMPESRELYRVFLGEFHWAPAYLFQNRPYYGYEGWTQGSGKKLPHPVHVTTERYLGESTSRDCSIEDTIHIVVPTKIIAEGMEIQWNGVEGKFFDGDGQVIAFDPSVRQAGPHTLLIREDAFQRFLGRADCELLWTVLGEKQVVGGAMLPEQWKGRLEISGTYKYSKDGVQGKLATHFKSRS